MKTVKTRAYKDLLKGHKDAVIGLFSPYGSNSGFLYSSSSDGFIRGDLFYFSNPEKNNVSLEFARTKNRNKIDFKSISQ